MRRLSSIGFAIALALSFSAAVPRSAYAITCNDETPYAVFYTDGSGSGSRLAVCFGDSYPSLSPTFDNNISSVVVVGPNNTGKVPCVYDYTSWAGNWAKLVTGQHGFKIGRAHV